MATHSSTLAWRTPCTEEPGGLQSMGVTKESDMTERLKNSSLEYKGQKVDHLHHFSGCSSEAGSTFALLHKHHHPS